MPTYEYKCDACGHSLEIFHKMSDPDKKKCPKCKKNKLKKQFSAPPVIFLGTGWTPKSHQGENL
jgi:putative FmdB family regulatory protein